TASWGLALMFEWKPPESFGSGARDRAHPRRVSVPSVPSVVNERPRRTRRTRRLGVEYVPASRLPAPGLEQSDRAWCPLLRSLVCPLPCHSAAAPFSLWNSRAQRGNFVVRTAVGSPRIRVDAHGPA